MVEVKNLYKKFGDKEVLKNINAKFERGKVNLIIGQSGSGKTVLLKSIVGLHEIDKGEIYYDGRIFSGTKTKYKKVIRREIGMVFQGGALFDSLTILENVMFPLDMFTKMSYEEKYERATYCLKRVNLKNIDNLYPGEISGGMAKRVAIARAIAITPNTYFLTNPIQDSTQSAQGSSTN
jgi:phospholipid/cholesterol/gamma-HCH transport system ATP-binding protein